jgi:hypothetical protein
MNPYRQRVGFVLLLLLSSCSSNASGPTDQGPPGQQDISDTIYVGGVNDEALLRLLDVMPKDDPRQALVVESPDLTEPLSPDSPATFKFRLASDAKLGASPRMGPPQSQPSKFRRPLYEFLQLLAPVRIAHAHGAPYNGTANYLVISDADSKPRLQVFTTGMAFTPEVVDWQNLARAPQPMTLTITSAFFEDNDVPASGGPFIGGKFPFRIE